MEIDKIITHRGTAHLDDFLSCCLCLHFINTIKEIKRVSSDSVIAEQKPDNEIWVDVGKEYSKKKYIFDHHQIDYTGYNGKEEVCSFNLLAMYFFNLSYSELSKYIPQFRYIALNDNLGPAKAMEEIVRSRNENNIFVKEINYPNIELRSLLDSTLLSIFALKDTYTADDSLFIIMKKIGGALSSRINLILSFKQTLQKENLITYYFSQSIVYIDRELPSSLFFALYEYLDTLNVKPKFIVSKSSQDPTCRVATRTKYCDIDLNKMNSIDYINKDNIKFIHKSGFMAVWHSNTNKKDIINNLIDVIRA